LSDTMRIAGTSLPLANMLTMLLEKNRMSYLPIIRDAYSELVDDKEDRVRGTVWTAYPLDPALLKKIEDALKVKFRKKELILSAIEDKSLIGGVKVEVKGTMIDGSVKRQLESLKENILKE